MGPASESVPFSPWRFQLSDFAERGFLSLFRVVPWFYRRDERFLPGPETADGFPVFPENSNLVYNCATSERWMIPHIAVIAERRLV